MLQTIFRQQVWKRISSQLNQNTHSTIISPTKINSDLLLTKYYLFYRAMINIYFITRLPSLVVISKLRNQVLQYQYVTLFLADQPIMLNEI